MRQDDGPSSEDRGVFFGDHDLPERLPQVGVRRRLLAVAGAILTLAAVRGVIALIPSSDEQPNGSARSAFLTATSEQAIAFAGLTTSTNTLLPGVANCPLPRTGRFPDDEVRNAVAAAGFAGSPSVSMTIDQLGHLCSVSSRTVMADGQVLVTIVMPRAAEDPALLSMTPTVLPTSKAVQQSALVVALQPSGWTVIVGLVGGRLGSGQRRTVRALAAAPQLRW